MVRFFRPRYFSLSRKVSATILAFTLFIGYFLGSCLAALTVSSFHSLMRSALTGSVSIVSLLSVTLLPFLFSAFAVYIRQYWLFLPIALFRCISFSFLGSVILYAFGSSGWLICLLFLFSDILSLPLLCWFWLRHISEGDRHLLRNLSAVFIVLSGIAILDHQLVSPFLVMLLS